MIELNDPSSARPLSLHDDVLYLRMQGSYDSYDGHVCTTFMHNTCRLTRTNNKQKPDGDLLKIAGDRSLGSAREPY